MIHIYFSPKNLISKTIFLKDSYLVFLSFISDQIMFTSAINYLAGAASSAVGGTLPASSIVGDLSGIGQDDPLVGSVIEVGEIRVFIRRRIGEGGFAFVYHAEDMADRSKTYALKRLLVRII